MLTFQTIPVGQELGRHVFVLDGEILARWGKLFPDDLGMETIPAGMTAVISMQVYSDTMVPRPPGNIHGRQRFEVWRLPQPGDTVLTTLHCDAKEVRGDRKWVRFRTETSLIDGRRCFTGLMSVVWAA